MNGEELLDSLLNLCTESWMCPLCSKNGIAAKVQLLQASEKQAVYFCETADCLYPHTNDGEPILVNRTPDELPADLATLEKLGFPPSLANESGLTFQKVCDLFLIKYAYNQMDSWLRCERELAKQQSLIEKESEYQDNLKNVQISAKCSPLNRLRNIPDDLLKYVRHFIPNIEEVVELLKLDML